MICKLTGPKQHDGFRSASHALPSDRVEELEAAEFLQGCKVSLAALTELRLLQAAETAQSLRKTGEATTSTHPPPFQFGQVAGIQHSLQQRTDDKPLPKTTQQMTMNR